jgi:hypothetical protein
VSCSFNLLTERYERRSIIVTTNLAFAEWVKVFGREAHHRAARQAGAPRHRDRHQGKESSNEEEGSERDEPRARHERHLAQHCAQGVGIKPLGGSVSDGRSGSVSDRRHQIAARNLTRRGHRATAWTGAAQVPNRPQSAVTA